MVEQTKTRSEWPARRTLRALGIPPSSYYRWLRERAKVEGGSPPRPVQAYEALEEEQEAVRRMPVGTRSCGIASWPGG